MRALIALYAIALIAAMPAEAQKAQTAAPSAADPSDTPSASAKPTLPDGLEWNSLGATAQCRDGTFYHDNPAHVPVPIMAAFGSGCLDASSP